MLIMEFSPLEISGMCIAGIAVQSIFCNSIFFNPHWCACLSTWRMRQFDLILKWKVMLNNWTSIFFEEVFPWRMVSWLFCFCVRDWQHQNLSFKISFLPADFILNQWCNFYGCARALDSCVCVCGFRNDYVSLLLLEELLKNKMQASFCLF